MVAAIREDRTPNLLLMRYALATWEVRDLLLIPSFMFSESAVIKRKPLAATARRAGWVGCNIALNRVPAEARIALVITRSSGREPAPSPSRKSRESQSRLTSAATGIFTTADAYAFTRELEKLHPDNRHVRDKIRQQLQVLRDLGLLLHVGRGEWRLP